MLSLDVATLGMSYLRGKVYVSAPTHVAVDNIAKRIDMLDQKIVVRYNEVLSEGQYPVGRRLIIRFFPLRDEIKAFRALL